MVDSDLFKEWLKNNTDYSANVISDIVSRLKRADMILPYDESETYLYFIEKQESFKNMSVSVRSQIRKAVKLYEQFKVTMRR